MLLEGRWLGTVYGIVLQERMVMQKGGQPGALAYHHRAAAHQHDAKAGPYPELACLALRCRPG